MHEVIPGARVEGKSLLDGPGHLRHRRRPGRGAAHDRHGLPAAQPVPDHVHLRQRGRRAASSTAGARSRRLDERGREVAAAAPTSGTRSRTGSTSRARGSPAGSSSGSASPVPSPSSRRSLLMDEPCSALDPISTLAIEDLISELKNELHDRHRDPQHAAGGPGQRPDRVLQHRPAGQAGPAHRDRRHHANLHQPHRRRRPRTTSPAASDDRPPRLPGASDTRSNRFLRRWRDPAADGT